MFCLLSEYTYPTAEVVAAMPPPRLVKTHLPYDLLPEKIINNQGKVTMSLVHPIRVNLTPQSSFT